MKQRSFNRAVLASVALVCMSSTAYALENEFHGMFRVKGILDNYDDGGAGDLVPAKNPGTRNYMEQRARLMYMAKANDDLKLVTQFEIDSRWGDNSYNSNNTTRNNGGAIGADQVNLETKNVYLDFNVPSTPVNVKLGIQGYTDPYKGILINNDAAGVSVRSAIGNGVVGLSYFRFDDAVTPASGTATFIANGSGSATTATPTNFTNTTPGNRTRDFLTLGGKYNITKDVTVGADYILLYSDILRNSQDRTNIHMVGVTGEGKVGPATIGGFILYQTGKLGRSGVVGNGQTLNAFAANVGAKSKIGPGTARLNLLYISGDNNPNSGDRNDFQTIMERGATTAAGSKFYTAEMLILLRNKYASNSDRALVFDLNNKAQGLIGGFVGYDLNIDKFFIYSNAGFAAAAKTNLNTPAGGSGNYLGTELNTEIGYKLYDNLTASVQAAYFILGDLYNRTAAGSNPENPYTARIMFNYTF
jgi:hypothetical protein